MKKPLILIFFLLSLGSQGYAAEASAIIYKTDGEKKQLGIVEFEDIAYGLLIIPKLSGLPPGLRGFHLHEHADCSHKGMEAGGHYDPLKTGHHQGPYGSGHFGDLPVLYVNEQGEANTAVIAPRLKVADLKNLSVMIHAGGDNYSDVPPLGGGGDRIACGPVKFKE